MNSINLHHLKYLVDAAQEGGISQSARKNYVTQSAVSRAVASLESDLGVELVIHGKNHFQLTEAGEAVLNKSSAVFEAVSELRHLASEYLNVYRGPLRLACNQAIASRLIAPALTQIGSKYPEITPVLKLGNTDQVQRMIDDQEVDFGVVVDDGEIGHLYESQKVSRGRVLVVKSPKLREKNPLEHLVVSRIQKGGLSEKYFQAYEKAYGRTLTPKLIVPSWQVIMDLAIAGYGCALVPEFLCVEALSTGKLEIVNHKVKPVSFELCTIVSKKRALPKNARALLEFLKSES